MPADIRICKHANAPLRGEITVPGDKSISHRAVMFGALAQGKTRIRHFLQGADCLSTIECFRQMGITVEEQAGQTPDEREIIVSGKGLYGLTAPNSTLYVGNSGTTMRLLAGIAAGQPFACVLDGDASIRRRPMKRIMTPLAQMGADISSLQGNGCAPLAIAPAPLHGIVYRSPVASAQVKSCVLLAGLYADGPVTVEEPVVSRDHTERMLRGFGADVAVNGTCATIQPGPLLCGQDITVPGDISSAAYFIAAALLVLGSEVLIRSVGINPTRDGFLRVVRSMGANVTLIDEREESGEPVADLLVRHSHLKGVTVAGEIIPALIDELPVVAVLGAFAEGTTVIADAAELKVKESDRIAVMTDNLRRMGADVTPTDDGMVIAGGRPLTGAAIDSHLDHRIAMSFAVAALAAEGETKINGAECVNISYPGFYDSLSAFLLHPGP